MPYTQKQLDRILNVSGHAYLAPDELPHLALRVGESYTRRRVFNIEDETVGDIYSRFRQAFFEWQDAAQQVADGLNLRTLAVDGNSQRWRREAETLARNIFTPAFEDMAKRAFDGTVAASLMAYYGRAWALDMTSVPERPIDMPRLSVRDASIQALREAHRGRDGAFYAPLHFTEVDDIGDSIIYQSLGLEWRNQYALELDDLIVDLRRELNASLMRGEDVRGSMRAVAKRLGVEIDRRRTTVANVRGNFNKVQTLTRSYIINRSNVASLDLYERNAELIQTVEFLPAYDGRVCPLCEGYRGQRWPLFSLDIIQPVRDTHLNCRCSLVPNVVEDLTWPADEPPRDTFREWSLEMGIAFLFGFDLATPAIDSLRV